MIRENVDFLDTENICLIKSRKTYFTHVKKNYVPSYGTKNRISKIVGFSYTKNTIKKIRKTYLTHNVIYIIQYLISESIYTIKYGFSLNGKYTKIQKKNIFHTCKIKCFPKLKREIMMSVKTSTCKNKFGEKKNKIF